MENTYKFKNQWNLEIVDFFVLVDKTVLTNDKFANLIFQNIKIQLCKILESFQLCKDVLAVALC